MPVDLSEPLPAARGVGVSVMTMTEELYASLEQRMAPICRSAVDTGEVAAYLEASGVNDRVAERDYGVTSVFTLAARLRADLAGYPTAGYAPGEYDPNAVATDRVGPRPGAG